MSRSAILGDLLSFRERSSEELEQWLSAHDNALATDIRAQAKLRGESLAQFLRIAAADFLAEADDDAWADLISAIRAADDPGARCMAKMTVFRMQLERAA